MPRQLVLSRVPVDLSIIEYRLDEGEEAFLTFTWDRIDGPYTHCTGHESRYISRIGHQGEITSHEYGLLLGAWFVQEEMIADELKDVEVLLKQVRMNGGMASDISILEQALKELHSLKKSVEEAHTTADYPSHLIRAHDRAFQIKYPSYKMVGQQGFANLTLNAWYVAYVNNLLGTASEDEAPHVLISPRQDQLHYSTYPCLVKWKRSNTNIGRMTIEDIKFNQRSNVENDDLNSMVLVQYDQQWVPRGDLIEFAVAGQQIIRDGEIVPVVSNCHQFTDFRHLIQMPNLNPDCQLYSDEQINPYHSYRPRQYFDQGQYGDIWLGEETFINDPTRNLIRAALSGPVTINIPTNATPERLSGAMQLSGYQEVTNSAKPLTLGEWRYVYRDHTTSLVEVYFKRNTYSWNMIGLSADNRRILCLACTGIPGKTGYKLEEASDLLLRAGAANALLLNQGKNVFQRVPGPGVELIAVVPVQRRRQRATFIFARPLEATEDDKTANSAQVVTEVVKGDTTSIRE